MALIRVTVDGTSSGFRVIPPGQWPVEVSKVTYTQPSSDVDAAGNPRYPYLHWEARILSPGEYQGEIVHFRTSLSPKAAWKLREVLLGFDLPIQVHDEQGNRIPVTLAWDVDEDTLQVIQYALERLDANNEPTGDILDKVPVIGARGVAHISESTYISSNINPATGQPEVRRSYQVDQITSLSTYPGVVGEVKAPQTASSAPRFPTSQPLRPVTAPGESRRSTLR